MTVDYAATIAAETTWVAADEQTVLGYVVLVDEGSQLLLDIVAVSPAAQGQGLGAALLELAEPDRQQRDTYRSYNIDATVRTAWLDETAFYALPRQTHARLVRAQVTHERAAVPTVGAWREVLGSVVKDQADGHRLCGGSRCCETGPRQFCL
jgi:N-acetylglutamate synthase-like GNAT family acetyltransferase